MVLSWAFALVLATPPPNAAFADDVGVRWRLGPPAADGSRARVGLELFDVDGKTLWFAADGATSALSAAEVEENWVRLFPPPVIFDECNGLPQDRDLPQTWFTDIREKEVVIADERGVRAYRRSDGHPMATWKAKPGRTQWPARSDASIHFLVTANDTSLCSKRTLVEEGMAQVCEGGIAGWFDGATAALFTLDPLTFVGRKRIDGKRVRTDSLSHWIRFRIGKWRVELESEL